MHLHLAEDVDPSVLRVFLGAVLATPQIVPAPRTLMLHLDVSTAPARRVNPAQATAIPTTITVPNPSLQKARTPPMNMRDPNTKSRESRITRSSRW